jgi:hypothetical protein
MPLPDGLQGVGRRIVDWFRRPSGANDPPPYQVYVYGPDREWQMRRALNDLSVWLHAPAQGVPCVSISLAEVFWRAIEDSGWAQEIFAQEREDRDDPVAQAEKHRAIAELLRAPVSFSQRVVDTIKLATVDGDAAVFLYRAGSLYPVFRTSGLLEDIRPRIEVPVTLLYPGELQGEFGLRFMSRWDPTYNYRALIVDGTNE